VTNLYLGGGVPVARNPSPDEVLDGPTPDAGVPVPPVVFEERNRPALLLVPLTLLGGRTIPAPVVPPPPMPTSLLLLLLDWKESMWWLYIEAVIPW
jgi:hypothetical protein